MTRGDCGGPVEPGSCQHLPLLKGCELGALELPSIEVAPRSVPSMAFMAMDRPVSKMRKLLGQLTTAPGAGHSRKTLSWALYLGFDRELVSLDP